MRLFVLTDNNMDFSFFNCHQGSTHINYRLFTSQVYAVIMIFWIAMWNEANRAFNLLFRVRALVFFIFGIYVRSSVLVDNVIFGHGWSFWGLLSENVSEAFPTFRCFAHQIKVWLSSALMAALRIDLPFTTEVSSFATLNCDDSDEGNWFVDVEDCFL